MFSQVIIIHIFEQFFTESLIFGNFVLHIILMMMVIYRKQVKWLEGRIGLRADDDYYNDKERCYDNGNDNNNNDNNNNDDDNGKAG